MRKNALAIGILSVMVAAAGVEISRPAFAQVTVQQPGTATHPGMMGMGPGMMGQGMGPGMMGQGMYPGMMGMCPGMMGMGSGMMGQGMYPGMMGMGSGMMGGWGPVQPAMNLSSNDVKAYFTKWLTAQRNPRLKLGNVAEKDADTITADIVTQEGSLAQRFAVDRHTGTLRQE